MIDKILYLAIRAFYPSTLPCQTSGDLTILSLTGARDFKRFLHAYTSLCFHLKIRPQCHVFDDGSLTDKQILILKKNNVKIFNTASIKNSKIKYLFLQKKCLDKQITVLKYKLWLLTTVQTSKCIILDSDVITLAKPELIHKWINNKTNHENYFLIYDTIHQDKLKLSKTNEFMYRKMLFFYNKIHDINAISNINTGLLLLNLNQCQHTLSKIELLLKNKSTYFMQRDFFLEERLFMLGLSSKNAFPLPNNYRTICDPKDINKKNIQSLQMLHCTYNSKSAFDFLALTNFFKFHKYS